MARLRGFCLGMGVGEESTSSEETLRFVRRHCVGFSSGVYKRLEVRLRSFPLRLALLLKPELPLEKKRLVATEFLLLRPCCVGPFGARLQSLFPSTEDLLSPHAEATLTVWLRSMLWTTYGCESERGSIRRLCQSSGRGRNFTLIARERLMESARTAHSVRPDAGQSLAYRRAAPGRRARIAGGPIAATHVRQLAAWDMARCTRCQLPDRPIAEGAPAGDAIVGGGVSAHSANTLVL